MYQLYRIISALNTMLRIRCFALNIIFVLYYYVFISYLIVINF